MDDIERQNDKERRLLAQLDAMEDGGAWESIVAYMAPAMAKDNPKTLAEAIIRRGMKRAEERKEAVPFPVDVAEVIAQTFAAVGVRLTLAAPETP